MRTVTIIKDYTSSLQRVLTSEELHRERVARVIGTPNNILPLEIRENLYDKNILWVVDQNFIEKFRHAACIGRGVDFEPSEHEEYPLSNPIRTVRYVGDLPDFVMDRMQTARECGLRFFTIHSAQPLPISEAFEKVDPVMVGWYNDPGIIFMNNFWEQRRFHHMDPTAQGVVIAIWDRDKELDIL